MTDDTAHALELDPELGQRWASILRKLEVHFLGLQTQGGLVMKSTSSGRLAWAVRYVDRSGTKPVHRTIFLGDDPRLIALVRQQLKAYRMLGAMTEAIAGHARLAATISFAARRLATGRRRKNVSRA